jgi:hypothetical protein
LKTLCHHSTIRLNVVYDLYYLWMLPLDFSVKYLKCTLFLSKSGQLHWLCYKQHCSVTDLNYYLTFLTRKQHCSVINLNYLFMLSTTRQRYQYRNHLRFSSTHVLEKQKHVVFKFSYLIRSMQILSKIYFKWFLYWYLWRVVDNMNK